MTYKKLDMGKNGIDIKVQMGKLKKFNGRIDVNFSTMGGELYLNSWTITQDVPLWFGNPEYDDTGMRLGHIDGVVHDKIIELSEGYYP